SMHSPSKGTFWSRGRSTAPGDSHSELIRIPPALPAWACCAGATLGAPRGPAQRPPPPQSGLTSLRPGWHVVCPATGPERGTMKTVAIGILALLAGGCAAGPMFDLVPRDPDAPWQTGGRWVGVETNRATV